MRHRPCGFPHLALIFFFFGCAPAYTKHLEAYRSWSFTGSRPDYSRAEYWAALPDKKDPSDSIPRRLRSAYMPDTTADVFFIHPTTFVDAADSAENADINDARLNARTDYTTILFQASVFNECRIYAPRYRQAHLRNYFTRDSAAAKKAFDTAYEDVRMAFEFYLKNFNRGRPIVIASHSQGTTHAERLLREYFENKPLAGRLVAAYIIGMPIPRNYFTGLQPCRDSVATGCVIGWRTFKEGFEPAYLPAEEEAGGSWVVNPLTWTSSPEYAPAVLNKGSVLTDFSRLPTAVTDARIHEGILWVHKPRFRGSFLLRTKNYHIGDINLFYMNIRENLRTRIRAYRRMAG